MSVADEAPIAASNETPAGPWTIPRPARESPLVHSAVAIHSAFP